MNGIASSTSQPAGSAVSRVADTACGLSRLATSTLEHRRGRVDRDHEQEIDVAGGEVPTFRRAGGIHQRHHETTEKISGEVAGSAAPQILNDLKVSSVRLLTNNPEKINQLTGHGVAVSGREPHLIPPNEHNRFYLETKANRSGHWIDFKGKTHLQEQSDPVVVSVDADA